MNKQQRAIFKLIKQIRTKVFKNKKLNQYENGFLDELTRQEIEKNKALFKKTWNIKLHSVHANGYGQYTYFLLKGYGKHSEDRFDWIPEAVAKCHLDAMFNKETPKSEFILFKSKKIVVSVDIDFMEVTLKVINKDESVDNYTREYKLSELPLFKNIAEQMK